MFVSKLNWSCLNRSLFNCAIKNLDCRWLHNWQFVQLNTIQKKPHNAYLWQIMLNTARKTNLTKEAWKPKKITLSARNDHFSTNHVNKLISLGLDINFKVIRCIEVLNRDLCSSPNGSKKETRGICLPMVFLVDSRKNEALLLHLCASWISELLMWKKEHPGLDNCKQHCEKRGNHQLRMLKNKMQNRAKMGDKYAHCESPWPPRMEEVLHPLGDVCNVQPER